MTNAKINLLDHTPPDRPSRPPDDRRRSPRRWRRRAIIVGLFFFFFLAAFLIANIIIPGVRLSQAFGKSNLFVQLSHLAFGGDRQVKGESDDRVNVLVMGIGGIGHDGPLLTDTIIVASLEPSTGKAALISIPRDLYVPYPDGSWRKINEAYSLGESLNPGHGGEYASSLIGGVIGEQLPYYVVIDFSGFERIVNDIGGVHVNVERSFTDTTYPLGEDGGIQTISFSAGWQWMNGATALEFARSRHGNNGEGSDFARAKRQQQILLAIKDRVLSTNFFLNTVAVNQVAGELADNIKTNIEPWELLRLYTLTKDIDPDHVAHITPDDAPGGLLVDATSADGAFILQPRSGSFSSIQYAIDNAFSNSALIQQPPRIEVQNGTTIPGLAATIAAELERRGYNVVAITNATDRTVKDTIIYDYTNGERPTSLAALRVLFNARAATGIPDWLVPSATTLNPNADNYQVPAASASGADFLVIVGTDSAKEITADVTTRTSGPTPITGPTMSAH